MKKALAIILISSHCSLRCAASRYRLQLYPGVEDTQKQLLPKYRLVIVSDGQTVNAVPELNAVGLSDYFNPVIVSGDWG